VRVFDCCLCCLSQTLPICLCLC